MNIKAHDGIDRSRTCQNVVANSFVASIFGNLKTLCAAYQREIIHIPSFEGQLVNVMVQAVKLEKLLLQGCWRCCLWVAIQMRPEHIWLRRGLRRGTEAELGITKAIP